MKQKNLVETILRRLLQEAESNVEDRGRRRLKQGGDMAVYTFTRRGKPAAVMYNTKDLFDNLKRFSLADGAVWYAMRGIIQISKPPLPCNGAWEIKYSAVKNKGDGGLLYGIAYAMSPNGILTPDRSQVSIKAQQGWLKQSSRRGKPFDDFHKAKEFRRTPNDPSDDCTVHVDDEYEDDCPDGHIDVDSLNRSYESEGWETALFNQMQAAHQNVLQQIPPDKSHKIFADMEESFMPFFHSNI